MSLHQIGQRVPNISELAQTIAENSVQGLVMMDEHGYCLYANQAWLEMTGYSLEDFRTKPVHDLVHHHRPDGRPFPLEECPIGCRLGKNLEVRGHEDLFFRKDGSAFPVACAATPITKDGAPVLMILEVRDITEERKAQQYLREREALLQMTLDEIPQMVWSHLNDGSDEYLNKQWYAFTGLPQGSLKKGEWISFVHPDDREMLLDAYSRSIAAGKPLYCEHRLRHFSGEYRWGLVRVLPMRDESGSVVRWFGTLTDVHEQKQLREQLETADRRKDEFLAMLAHELRNPMAPIGAAAELLRLLPENKQLVRQTSEIISRQVRHMASLVDDLLDVSRVTRGLFTLEKIPVDIKQVVAEAVEQVRPLIELRKHSLRLHIPPAGAFVFGDYKRLVQVVANLLDNAAKYTLESGLITLTVENQESRVKVVIADAGIGMAPEMVKQAFDLFIQAERTSDRSQGGLGLGLALVRSIVELHDGKVIAQSDGVGLGSTFTVLLPRAHEHAEPETRPVQESRPAAAEALSVMVVDDNIDAAETLAMLLQALGHQVIVEHSAGKALERVKSTPLDVCLLDIGLPDMDGKELARCLRSQQTISRPLLVAVTGYGQEQDRESSHDAGFDYHFTKPVDPVKLQQLLKDIAQFRTR